MENQVDERSISFYILRFVKISRIILFGSIICFQMYFALMVSIIYYLPSIAPACFIIIMDVIMFNKRKDDFKEFYLVSVIICIIAVGITAATLFPLLIFPYLSDFYLALFYLLGFAVMLISCVELITLIYLTRPQEDYKEKVWETEDELWESEKDTVDIQ